MSMRNRLGMAALAVLGAIILSAFINSASVEATQPQAVLVPNTDALRFELVGNEPIAGPDGRSQVKGWSVLVLRDRQSDRCHIVFQHTSGIAVEPAQPCAEIRPPK